MKISIIVPIYNSEKTIEKCLNSILEQDYKNIEVILINDGSTDCSKRIIEEYKKKDSRVKVFNNDNHGVSYSRNFGMSVASGDYITFVDSDDFLDHNCYSSLIEFLEKGYDVVRYNFKTYDGKAFNNNLYDLSNKVINLNSNNIYKVLSHFLISSKESIPNLTMLLLIKKELCRDVSFIQNLTMMEDVDFYFQLFLRANNIYFSDLKLYNYYVNPKSVTNSPSYYKKNIFGIIDTNVELIKKCYNNNLDIINLLNYNHVRIISEYVLKMYINNKKDFDTLYKELIENEHFQFMLKNSKGYSKIKNKIIIFIFKLNNIKILKFYFKILELIYKLKNSR